MGAISSFNTVVMRHLALLTGLTALVLCGGCDDDDVATPRFQPESVPESKPIDDLDEDEQQAFCDEAKEWAQDIVGNDLPTVQCNAEGITAAVADEDGSFDLAACKAAREACLSEPSEFDIEDEGLECNFDGIESCDATVGEFSACYEEIAVLLDRVVKATTCERFADGDYPDESEYSISAGCEALFERCGGAEDDVAPTDPPPPE